ncbi:MAG: 50S ribosomal protein L4 [Thermoguttaceae bacterium]|nr:50S ribosomal protein L4 [Thermoguttaceae bacterium]MDW8079714.1 50S ribosomal protein L4 [Thermoguttaceae bacterium]
MTESQVRADKREKSMLVLPVFDRAGQQVGSYELDLAELAPRISKQLLHDAVVMYQANKRLGTVKTKSRGEVAGSTRKLYRQKGTGRARAGSRRSPTRVGGGHAHALRPRDWYYRLPKQALRLATRMALAARFRDGEVKLINELTFAEPKTREMAATLKALELDGLKTLVVVEQYDVNVYKSVRNLADAWVMPVSDLNALEVLRPKRLLMTTAALDAFRKKIKEEQEKKAGRKAAGQLAAATSS